MIYHFLVIEHLYRMSDNPSQLGRESSESSLENCKTQTNIVQLLTVDFVTTGPSSYKVTTTTTTIVANGSRQIPAAIVQNTPTVRQRARRRMRQRRASATKRSTD
jgi:hypothetical protein